MIAPNDKNNPEQTEPINWHSAQYKTPRNAHRFAWMFGIFMVCTAGVGFCFKLYEFIHGFTSDGELHFAVIPVMTYLIVAAGYLCMFIWAYLGGQFKNIESAKYRMLEMQQEIDASEKLESEGA